jgi:hypothetical protein
MLNHDQRDIDAAWARLGDVDSARGGGHGIAAETGNLFTLEVADDQMPARLRLTSTRLESDGTPPARRRPG